MKFLVSSSTAIIGLAICSLSGCSQTDVNTAPAEVKAAAGKVVKKTPGFEYISMEGFSYEMAGFLGLQEGESFAVSEGKINAVFKAYDGHTEPQSIDMDATIVEAGWKQVLVTQNGLMDGTVTGQQLLAVFNEDNNLVSYGMRIKCHTANGSTDWQTAICE